MAFKKGTSGNPDGRAPGKTPATALKKIIAESMPDILEVMIKQALAGDILAAKSLADKIIPNLKPQSANVIIATGASLSESGSNVINSAMTGAITPDTGALLLTSLAAQARIVEVTELEQRIIALEGGGGTNA